MAKQVLRRLTPLFRSQRKLRTLPLLGHRFLLKTLIFHDIPSASLPWFRDLITDLQNSYQFVTPDQAFAALEGRESFRGLGLLITFDDGFVSSFRAAQEVLDPLGIRALFFLPSAFVGIERDWSDFVALNILKGAQCAEEIAPHQAPMSWKQARILVAQGHEMGGHTATHCDLAKIAERDFTAELVDAKLVLENELGSSIRSMAWTFGDLCNITPAALACIERHYRYCFSGLRGYSTIQTPKWGLLRDEISLGLSLDLARLTVEDGLSWWYYRRKQRLFRMLPHSL